MSYCVFVYDINISYVYIQAMELYKKRMNGRVTKLPGLLSYRAIVQISAPKAIYHFNKRLTAHRMPGSSHHWHSVGCEPLVKMVYCLWGRYLHNSPIGQQSGQFGYSTIHSLLV